jgi:hypothetical protein
MVRCGDTEKYRLEFGPIRRVWDLRHGSDARGIE